MELFLITQFSLFGNKFLQYSLLLEVDAYNLGFYSRKPLKNSSSVIYPTKGTVSIYFLGGREGKGFSRTHAFIPIKDSVAFNLKSESMNQ